MRFMMKLYCFDIFTGETQCLFVCLSLCTHASDLKIFPLDVQRWFSSLICLFSAQVWEMSWAPSLWCTRAKGRPGGFAPDPAERFQPQPRSTANMLIKEYRIPMPMSVEEYRIAQLYMIQVCSWLYLTSNQSKILLLITHPHTDLCLTIMFLMTTSVKLQKG